MMKETQTIFEIVNDINKDLVDPQVIICVSEDNGRISLSCTEEGLYESRYLDSWSIETRFDELNAVAAKKMILTNFYYNGTEANTYQQCLKQAKVSIAKKRSVKKVMEYLKNRYGIEFRSYANGCKNYLHAPVDRWHSNVIYPSLQCRLMPMFRFCNFFSLRFDGTEISEKSLKSFCRKMDIVAERMKCIAEAFNDSEVSVFGGNFYGLCQIKKNSNNEWVIKFPYKKRVWAENSETIKKLMEMYRYKDSDYCIWKGSSPEHFRVMREFLQ